VKTLGLLSNAGRAKTIFAVLARHGFAGLFAQADPNRRLWRRLMPAPAVQRGTYERIRLAAEELGPTFVKFGQLMSMRPDVLPDALILELRKLQNDVQPLPFAAMRSVLVDELDCDPAAVFSEFRETPVASASLAQVYFARLLDGRTVAVKIQRPHLHKTIHADLELIAWFAAQAHQHIATLRPYDLPSVVAEVRANIHRELDFRHEARNQEFFNAQNPQPDRVFAPRVVPEFSGERVLVMEFVAGRSVNDVRLAPEFGRRLAADGASSLFRQVLIAGFFHADPHAGNVLISDDGRLCLLDWGLAGNLTPRLRYALADLLGAAVDQDAERVVRIAVNLGGPGSRPDLPAMERDVMIALRDDLNFIIGREQLGRAMIKLLYIFGRNGIHLTRDYSMMAKSVLSIEEVGRTLDPDFDLRIQARPVLQELQKERTGPAALLRNARRLLHSSLGGIQDLPGDIYRIIRRIEHDDLTINFQHRGLGGMEDAFKTAANRVTLGVIIGALIVGSSLIITTNIAPYLLGYPALGIVGYLLSAVLGLYVIWDIFRHGRHK
jgi:ubiquinone biosynthesis protein